MICIISIQHNHRAIHSFEGFDYEDLSAYFDMDLEDSGKIEFEYRGYCTKHKKSRNNCCKSEFMTVRISRIKVSMLAIAKGRWNSATIHVSRG
jgi:hypothetical protein